MRLIHNIYIFIYILLHRLGTKLKVMYLCEECSTNISSIWDNIFPQRICFKVLNFNGENAVTRIGAHLLLIYHSSSLPFSFNNVINKINFERRYLHIFYFELERNFIELHGFLKKKLTIFKKISLKN